jgi:hypothetical protein
MQTKRWRNRCNKVATIQVSIKWSEFQWCSPLKPVDFMSRQHARLNCVHCQRTDTIYAHQLSLQRCCNASSIRYAIGGGFGAWTINELFNLFWTFEWRRTVFQSISVQWFLNVPMSIRKVDVSVSGSSSCGSSNDISYDPLNADVYPSSIYACLLSFNLLSVVYSYLNHE